METESKGSGTLQGVIVGITILAATWMIFNGMLMIADGTKQLKNEAAATNQQGNNKSINDRSDAEIRNQCRESFRGSNLYSNTEALDACVKSMKEVVPDLEKYCSTHRC